MIIWWVWLLFAAANLVDLAVQGRDHFSLVAAGTLLLGTGVAYVLAQRPRLVTDDAGITIKNPLFDHRIGWAGVTRIDLADLLRVHCASSQPGQRDKIIGVWAVHYSRRRKFAAENRSRRAAVRAEPRRSSLGLPYSGGGFGNAPDASPVNLEAEKIAHQLSERATAGRAEAVWAEGTAPIAGSGQPGAATPADQAGPTRPAGEADAATPAGEAGGGLRGTGWLEPLTSTWSRSALAALLVPALILLVVWLL